MRTLGVARLFLVPIVLFLLPGVGRGQEWIEYVSRDDLFTVNFPAQPTVSTVDWKTEYGLTLRHGEQSLPGDGRELFRRPEDPR